ncbi:unnamed protein product [Adineta steineri]|uniref:Uncharacterized protein n=1 Tax=Adineta steineri TaxID=433720 RepID=A0A815GU06_9BILA|nr:unnamed protein product [Adineta steineri]CAF3525722.1 unnamed protein product [Adineta steineri]
MAVKTLHTAIPIDPSVIKIISNQATQLIEQIQRDIENENKLSERTYKTCNTILQDAHKDYIRIQIEFVEETKNLITKALQEPNIRFHKTWLHAFDMFAARCEQIAGPILQVLNSVALESSRLKDKYQKFVAGATASSVVFTVLIGGLITHFLPASICCFTLSAGAIALTAGGALLAAALAISCIIGAMNIASIRAVYDRCTSELQLLLTKYLPCIFNAQKNVITKEELNQAIKDSLNTFKIKEDVWTNVDILEMLERSTDRALDALKEKIAQ